MDKETSPQERSKALEEAAKPLMVYLANNYHPHVTCIVTSTCAELMEGIMSTGLILDHIPD